MARSRRTWPRPIGEQTHSARRLRSRANSQGVGAGEVDAVGWRVHVDELLDQRVHEHGMAAVRHVAGALDLDQPPAGHLGHRAAPLDGLAVVLGAVDHQDRTGQAGERLAGLVRVDEVEVGVQPHREGLRVGLERPRHHVLLVLGRVGLGEHQLGVVVHPLLVATDPARVGHVLDDVVLRQGDRHGRRDRHHSPHPVRRDVREVHRPARAAAQRDQERRVHAEVVHHGGHVPDVERVGLVRGEVGRPDSPLPRGSIVTTRKCRDR